MADAGLKQFTEWLDDLPVRDRECVMEGLGAAFPEPLLQSLERSSNNVPRLGAISDDRTFENVAKPRLFTMVADWRHGVPTLIKRRWHELDRTQRLLVILTAASAVHGTPF